MLSRLLATLTLALGLASAAGAEQYRLALITPPQHQWTKTATLIAERLRAETEGRVDLLIFPSGQLGPEAQVLQQLQTGAVDFGFMTLGEFANRNEDYGVFLAPYLVRDLGGARMLLRGPVAHGLLDGVGQFGLHGLGWGMAGMRQIAMRDQASTVADLKGRKIRSVPLSQELSFWTQIGAAPTPLPLPSLYDAFANGQIDGMQIDFENLWANKYIDHAGVVVRSDHMLFPMLAVASARKWATIASEDQAVIARVMGEEIDRMNGLYSGIDSSYLAKIETAGVPIITADRAFFGSAIDRWYAEWRTRTPLLVKLEAEAAALRQ